MRWSKTVALVIFFGRVLFLLSPFVGMNGALLCTLLIATHYQIYQMSVAHIWWKPLHLSSSSSSSTELQVIASTCMITLCYLLDHTEKYYLADEKHCKIPFFCQHQTTLGRWRMDRYIDISSLPRLLDSETILDLIPLILMVLKWSHSILMVMNDIDQSSELKVFTFFMKKQLVEDEKKVTDQVYERIKTYMSSLHIRAGTTNHHGCESLSPYYWRATAIET